MEYSEQGLGLTAHFEGCRLSAYQDSVGVWTIGYGHTAGVQPGDIYTQEQADQSLTEDVAWAVKCVNEVVNVELTQGQFDALVDFTFNLGSGNFQRSDLLKLVNAGNFTEAALEFPKWSYAGGKQLPGLLKRRQAEADLFQGLQPTLS